MLTSPSQVIGSSSSFKCCPIITKGDDGEGPKDPGAGINLPEIIYLPAPLPGIIQLPGPSAPQSAAPQGPEINKLILKIKEINYKIDELNKGIGQLNTEIQEIFQFLGGFINEPGSNVGEDQDKKIKKILNSKNARRAFFVTQPLILKT